jgi:hypothetical protein
LDAPNGNRERLQPPRRLGANYVVHPSVSGSPLGGGAAEVDCDATWSKKAPFKAPLEVRPAKLAREEEARVTS